MCWSFSPTTLYNKTLMITTLLSELIQTLEKSYDEALYSLVDVASVKQLDSFKSLYLGKKSPLSQVMQSLGKLSTEEKPLLGQKLNEFKTKLESEIEKRKEALKH